LHPFNVGFDELDVFEVDSGAIGYPNSRVATFADEFETVTVVGDVFTEDQCLGKYEVFSKVNGPLAKSG
jgi:hypothetical protein